MEYQNGAQERIYPLRPSELVGQPDFLAEVEPLVLSKEEKRKLMVFEEPLFDEAQKLKKILVSTHVIYPDAFANEEGSKLFSAIYLDSRLKTKLEGLANELGVDLEKTSAKRQVYDAFFEDLLGIVSSPDDFQKYQEGGVVFEQLSEALDHLEGKSEEQVVLKGDIPLFDTLSEEEIRESFIEIELTSIPGQLRTRANRYSSEWAKEQFTQALQNNDK